MDSPLANGSVDSAIAAKQELLSKIFTQPLPEISEIEAKYPPRKLAEGALVTRVAPSPTGFMHIGTLYMSLISERLAHQSNGVFFLRIEDTDQKREIPGSSELIVKTLDTYGVTVDEGQTADGSEKGDYAPYKQSSRAALYQAYIKSLLEKGQAYPCFCTFAELDEMRQTQEKIKARPGYYGTWAKCRNKSAQESLDALNSGLTYGIRFKSTGDFRSRVRFKDLIKGSLELAENDLDIPILKGDGLPTYHFAHVVDDHLMKTTLVTRGDEWLASVPLHLQLFQTMGWPAPQYAHLAPLQKIDETSKRKLSKRKDPEASMTYYKEQGYPIDAVLEYLTNLANSNFEDWRKANPEKNLHEFVLTIAKLGHSSGALFDFVKLNDVSKGVIARYDAEKVYQAILTWSEQFDPALKQLMEQEVAYTKEIINIERTGDSRARKDLTKWSDARTEIIYFYDSQFQLTKTQVTELLTGLNPDTVSAIVKSFISTYLPEDNKDIWLEKLRALCQAHDFAANMKDFKANPSAFPGTIVDVTKIFRVLLTGRTQTPDLYAILQVMGKQRMLNRLNLIN